MPSPNTRSTRVPAAERAKLLGEIGARAAMAAAAQSDLRASCLDAVRKGCGVVSVASHAGVSPTTLRKWLDADQPDPD